MQKQVSDRKLAAQRENARKSTGPRSEAGKLIASLNAMTLGVYSKHPVLVAPPFSESLADYLSLQEGLRAELNPLGTLEETAVKDIGNGIWRTKRLARYDAARIMATARSAAEQLMRHNFEKELTLLTGSGKVTGLFRELINLADHFNAGSGRIDDEKELLAFVWARNLSVGANEVGTKSEGWITRAREYLTNLSESDRQDLKAAFRQEMRNALSAMFDRRAQEVVLESAVELSLVPDEVELEKLLRYETHLSRQIAGNLRMLLDLQAARRERNGGVGP